MSGRVETGSLNGSDKVLICPSKEMATAKAVSIDEISHQVVFAGDQVTVTLSGVEMQNMSIGYILCDPNYPVPVSSKFEARLVVFNVTVPITKGYSVNITRHLIKFKKVILMVVGCLASSITG